MGDGYINRNLVLPQPLDHIVAFALGGRSADFDGLFGTSALAISAMTNLIGIVVCRIQWAFTLVSYSWTGHSGVKARLVSSHGIALADNGCLKILATSQVRSLASWATARSGREHMLHLQGVHQLLASVAVNNIPRRCSL